MRRAIWTIAGVMVVAGAAAAIAAVGDDDGPGRGFGHRGFGGGEHRGHREGRDRGGDRSRGMTEDQFDTLTRERFARLDRNSDGVIDSGEVEAGIASRMGERGGRMGDAMLHRLLARFDTNHDGKVSRDEFLDSVKKEFARADLNNDGRITDDDLPPMMRGRDVLKRAGGEGGGIGHRGRMGGMDGMGMGMGMGGMIGRLIAADANKDGVITLDEVLATAGRRFDLLDRNKDGVVDKADFDAMHKEMQAYMVQRFLHRYGADKDGRVTRDQYFQAAKQQFAARDASRDGRLDRRDSDTGGEPRMGREGRMGRGMGPGMGPGRGPGMTREGGGDRGPMDGSRGDR